jgi:hypothetical protein
MWRPAGSGSALAARCGWRSARRQRAPAFLPHWGELIVIRCKVTGSGEALSVGVHLTFDAWEAFLPLLVATSAFQLQHFAPRNCGVRCLSRAYIRVSMPK